MNIQTISLIFTILIVVIAIIPILIGLIGGFKKSLSSTITNLVLCIGLLIIVPIVTKNLINADLSSLNINLNGHDTIKDFLLTEIKNIEGMQDLLTNCPSVETLITELPLLITTPILFTVFFWLFKLIFFIFGLLGGLVKLIIKAFSRKKPKVKKHHGFGALVGVANSAILLFASFVSISGFCGICNKLNAIEVQAENSSSGTQTVSTIWVDGESTSEGEEEKQTTTLFTQMFGEEATVYLNAINDNVALKVVKYTGIGPLADITFNQITSTTIDDTRVSLADEINSIFNVIEDINSLNDFDFNTATQEEINKVLTTAKNIIDNLFGMKTVTVAGNELIPYIALEAQKEDSLFYIPKQDNENINAIITAVLNSLSEHQVQVLKQNFENLIDIAKLVNNNGLVIGFRDADLSHEKFEDNVVELIEIFNDVQSTFAEEFSTKFFEITIFEDIAPTLVNSGMDELFKQLDLEFTKGSISNEDAINYLSKILASPIKLIKSLSTSEKYFLTQNSFEVIGELLDDLTNVNVLSQTAYNKIIEKAQTTLTDYINNYKQSDGKGPFDDGNIDLTYNINSLANIKSTTSNFKTEVTKYYDVYKAFVEIINEVEKVESMQEWFETTDMKNVGKMLDALEKTLLFKNVNDIYNGTLNYVYKNYPDFENSVKSLKLTTSELSSDINWEKEIPALKPLLVEAFNYIQSNPDFSDTNSLIEVIDIISKMSELESNTNSVVFSAKMEPLTLALLTDAQKLSSSSDVNNLANEITTAINNRTTETLEKTVVRGIINYAKTFIPSQETIDSITDESIKSTVQGFINDLDQILVDDNVDYVKEIKKLFSVASKISKITNLSNATKEEIVDVVIDVASDYINNLDYEDNIGLVDAITQNKQEIIDNVNLDTLAGELDTLIDSAETILNETNNLTEMNVESVSNALETIKNSESFSEEVTNIVFDKMLDAINTEIQNDTNYTAEQKTQIQNYITENKVSGTTVKDGDYEAILNELFNKINTNA